MTKAKPMTEPIDTTATAKDEQAAALQVAPTRPTMITPAVSVDEAVEQFEQYQSLKERLANENDFQQIGNKKHPKKSFVRKMQRFFNLSVEIRDMHREEHRDDFTWYVTCRATHLPTGAFQDGDGACSASEKHGNQDTEHNVRAHAVTRAKNRAVLDLVGFGEVSAEEINQGDNNTSKGYGSPYNPADSDPRLPYGKSKGKRISEAPTNDLEWMITTLDEDDPKWGRKNRQLKADIDAELEKREGNQTADADLNEAKRMTWKLAQEYGVASKAKLAELYEAWCGKPISEFSVSDQADFIGYIQEQSFESAVEDWQSEGAASE